MDKIKWCINKNGLTLNEPSDNLCDSYFEKAQNALKAVKNEKNNPEWEITAAYYSMYFSSYALLLKLGIKSEIHSCTIEVLRVFLDSKEIELLEKAKDLRQRIQYYIPGEKEIGESKEVIRSVYDFYLMCKKLSSELDINLLRKKFNKEFKS